MSSNFEPYIKSWANLNRPMIPLWPTAKKPMYTNITNLPPCSEEDIREIINKYKDCNLGMVCGNGIIVFDFDKSGHYDKFRKLEPNLNTLIVKTGRGHHIYFKNDDLQKTSDFYLPGNETKSGELKASGYIVSPGSMHESGKQYEVIEGSFDSIQRVDIDFINKYNKNLKRIQYRASVLKTNGSVSTLDYSSPNSSLLFQKMRIPNKHMSMRAKLSNIHLGAYKSITDRSPDEDRSAKDMSNAYILIRNGVTEEDYVELAEKNPDGLGAKQSDRNDQDNEYLRHTYRKALGCFDFNRYDPSVKKTKPSYKEKQIESKLNKIQKMLENNGGIVSVRDIIRTGIYPKRSEAIYNLNSFIKRGMFSWDNQKKTRIRSKDIEVSNV